MIGHFRVAVPVGDPGAELRRGQVYVHLYDDREELAEQHARHRGAPVIPETRGGVAFRGDWSWPDPDPQPIIVMRLWTEQLTVSTVAHECLHAAAALVFMYSLKHWDARARTMLLGDNEALAYATGDLTKLVCAGLHDLGYAVSF